MPRRTLVASIPLGLITALFVLKYVLRAGGPGWIAAAVCLALWFAVVFLFRPRTAAGGGLWSRRNLIGVLFLVCLAAFVLTVVWPEGNRVGRLPAFRDWITNLFSGHFPYDDPVLTSGFPVIYLIAIPAYLAGNIGLIQVLALGFFSFAVMRQSGSDLRSAWLQTAALLLLPTVYYEVLVRSDLFFNMTLIILLILLTDGPLEARAGWRRLAWIGVLFGLALSSRTIVGLVYAVYLPYRFRTQIPRGILFSGIAIVVFLLTLLPFYLWDPALFLAKGPFGAQLRHLPVWIDLLFLAAAVLLGWTARDLQGVLFRSGLLLFGTVAVAFCLAILDEGFQAILSIDRFDISYFVFCTPFLLLSLRAAPRTAEQ